MKTGNSIKKSQIDKFSDLQLSTNKTNKVVGGGVSWEDMFIPVTPDNSGNPKP